MHVLAVTLLLLVRSSSSETVLVNDVYTAYTVPPGQQPVAAGGQQPVVMQQGVPQLAAVQQTALANAPASFTGVPAVLPQGVVQQAAPANAPATLTGLPVVAPVAAVGKATIALPASPPPPAAQQLPAQPAVNVITVMAPRTVATAADAANTAANNAAANAANAAATAAHAAAVAASTAANAAASAHTAADAAASANTAANAAASAHTAADAAASADVAAHAAAAMANAAANTAAHTAVSASGQPAAVAASVNVPVVPVSRSWSASQWFMHLIVGLTFAMVVKALCIVGNVLVQVSPFPQVMRWNTRECTGEADPAPYVSIAFGGCQWCFYGMFAWLVTNRSGFLILVQSNILGALLGTYYVRTFYCNCRSEASLVSLQKYLSGVTSLALLQVCAIGVLPAERALFLTGLISSFCSFIGATSVLVTVPAVIRTKDSRSIPGPYAVANLASSLVWSLCGYILDDPLVMVPNLFSCCCAATSLGLKVYFPSDLFSTGTDKLGSVEEGIDSPMQDPSVAKKLQRKATEFTPLKLKASECDTSAHILEKLAGIAAEPMPVCGDGTGGTC